LNIRGVEEKKTEEKRVLTWNFLFLLFLYNYSFASAVQRRLEKLKFHDILNHSKWRRIERDLPKCSMID
jgi:hypothetical protein